MGSVDGLSTISSLLLNTSTNSTTQSPEETRCQYGSLTGSFGIFIQFLLASIAFSCLIVKRFCEPREQRRPWIIWFYDTSKQGVGATLIHFANVFVSQSAKDPCVWYVMNFLLDSTVGLILIYICLKLIAWMAHRCSIKDLRNGEYGDPPKCSRWLVQCVVYSLVLVAQKAVVVGFMSFSIWAKISEVIVSPIRNAKLELVLVMFVVPIVVNVLIFWIVDNLLMRNLRLPRFRTSRKASLQYNKLNSEDASDAERESTLL